VVSIGRLLAPQADAFRPMIERFLARQIGQPVRIERIEASWPRLSPQVSIRGLRVGAGDARLIDVDRARMEFKLYNLVRPGRNSVELIVLGLDMSLLQDEQGRWRWRLDRGGSLPAGWERALSAGDLLVRDSSVEIVPRDLPRSRWTVTEAYLNRIAERVGIRLRADALGGPEAAVEFRVELELDGAGVASARGYAQSVEPARIPGERAEANSLLLPAGAQAWLAWNRDGGGRLHARLAPEIVDATDSEIPARGPLTIDARWRGNRVRAEFNSRIGESGRPEPIVGLALGAGPDRVALAADRIDLGFAHALLSPWLESWPLWPERLDGVATSLELGGTRGGSLHRFDGLVDGLDLEWREPAVGVFGMSLALGLSGDAPSLALSGPVELHLPALYRDPIRMNGSGGAIVLRKQRLDLRGVAFDHDDVVARVDGSMHFIDGRTFLDLVVDMPRLTPEVPRRWLPLRGLPPKTRGWLDEALLGVGRATAVTALHGYPERWSRHVPDGSVNSEIEFSGLRLAYARGWPVAEDVSGRVVFSGQRMYARAEAGTAAGVALRAPEVRIADTRNARIEVSVETAEGVAAADLAALAVAFPLDEADAPLSAMDWSGPASARARVWLPVRHREDWRLLGSVDFHGAALDLPAQGIALDGITGELPFTRDGLGPASIEARMHDRDVRFGLESRFRPSFSMSLSGRFPVRGLIPASWHRSLPRVFERLGGSADVDFEFAATDEDVGGRGFDMRVVSDLQGLRSELPAPFGKSAAERLALTLAVPLNPGATRPLEFTLGEIAHGVWLQNGSYWQLGLGFGDERAGLPVAENFRIEGHVAELEPGAWARLLGSGLARAAAAGRGPEDRFSGWLDVSVGDLRLASGSLGALDLVINREGEYWRLNLAGRRVDGSVRFPAAGAVERPLVADFDRIHWPLAGREDGRTPNPPSELDPVSVPALDLAVDDLRLGALTLGEFRFKSHRRSDGLEIEQVSARRDGFEMNGSGAWISTGGGPSTRMRLRVSAADLGSVLRDAGFGVALQAGRAMIGVDGQWPGSPLDLSLERLDGSIDLVITDGAIPEASPGAGRLLGLVSLNSIPRRLRLDFSDVFGEGLSFDRVAGRFELAGGVARTDELRIDAPAAEILVHGRADLSARTYDQTLIVRPGVSSALPVIGALAGGPVGAAAGAALQQIFSRPLKGISEVRYSVTGSWDDPVIAPVSVRARADAPDG